MKRTVLTFILLLTMLSTYSQDIINGWYYLPEPAGNIWGIGYHKPQKGKALSYAGNMQEVKEEEDVIVLPGPKSTYRYITQLKSLIATSLFHGNKAIKYDIYYSTLKQVLLKSDIFKDFDNGNYYVTQALKADSVVIKGKVDKDMGGNTADAEKIITSYVNPTQGAFKVVNTLSNKDTTKSTGIVSYSKTDKDSFTIVITEPDVFFAVKLTQVQNIGNPEKKIEIGKENDSIPNISEEPTDVIYWHYTVNRGLDVGIRFYVKDDVGIAEAYSHYGGKSESILFKQSKKISDKPVHFLLEGSMFTPNIVKGKHTAVDYLITAIGSFSYIPASNSVIIDQKNVDGKFRTAVYHVEGKYTTWP
ncbi:hypothetical protein [Chitinophaga sancti]|uniref:Uncharacterized protein n=1 Tax=Chitinophaga sancti TaxID=1004 RepID=A0A1K1RVV3_9BACT|nr:hypothetical protein [Chitinophaga sancti]WQD63977.1 hypothetical protein U0033_06175 [Chitinophaga sancti]WQG90399.1 hypothetical protein SR876_02745 [Chitinophaga sancti]SFW76283.1 hypothetical protein SAMN05661012_04323 [Chitinophaga sancti]